ncbi:MAG TPA: hypothetical protein VJ842_00770 [Pyrinomonadaceae bacterium]|nr:hypothetical protein [Pyrinomonadaceae bacterium]
MKDSERRSFEMLLRVRDFGSTHTDAFAEGSRGRELFAVVNQIVGQLETHGAAQSSNLSAGAQGTRGRAGARAELREDLEAISRTARAMSFDTPGIAERFRLPRGNRNDQQLLNTARAFATDAATFRAEFIRHELPADFLEDLNADIDDFEEAITAQNHSKEARVAATEAIDTAVDRGADAVRQLDAVVRNKFRDDPATLAAWTSASHVERAPRRRQLDTPQPPPPPKP